MKKLKQSGLIKTLLIILALFSSYVGIHCGIETMSYLDNFSYEATSYTETNQFEQLFLKYAERAAVYVAYLEEGFVPDPNSIYYSSDLLSMLNGSVRGNLRPSESVYTATQESFEYYNRILNYDSECFYYFVENTTTGEFYYNPNFEKLLKEADSSTELSSILTESPEASEPLSVADFETYLQNISTFPAYLVINTQNDRYITNVNKSTYYIINDSSVSWIADFLTKRNTTTYPSTSSDNNLYINGDNETFIITDAEADTNITEVPENNDESLEEASTEQRNYVIYTFILNDDASGNDEFCKLNNTFLTLRAGFDNNVNYAIIALLLLILSLGLLCICAGHKKGIEGIYLNSFDMLYTEISLLIICSGIGLVCFAFLYIYETYELHFYRKQLICFTYLICFIIGTLGLTSFVKRIKGHVLVKRSLLYIIIHLCFQKVKKFFRKLIYSITHFFANKSAAVKLTMELSIFSLIEIIILISTHDNLLYCLPLLTITFVILAGSLIKTFSDMNLLTLGAKKISGGDLNAKIPVSGLSQPSRTIAESINNIGDGLVHAVDEKLKSERLKAELITNVSHDIKTPLTSIINYVDLLNKEPLDNERAKGYLEILTEKAWRLKTLIEDLVEASKASSGAITLNPERLNIVELIKQALGEFDDRLLEKQLELVLSITDEDIHIYGDGHSTYRIIENLLSNVYKYALSNTRVYVSVSRNDQNAFIQIKNISATRLGTSGEELMERFVRGDSSRHSEGSGLGLSIAKSLATLQHGNFEIILDGDLFKTIITLPLYSEEQPHDSWS